MKKIKMYFVNKILLMHGEYQLLKKRWHSVSPNFFIKLKWLSIKVGGSAVAVIGVNSAMNLNLSPDLITKLGYVTAICAAIAGTSQLTVDNPDDLKH